MGKLFGTDGVRGIANEFLTCELAERLGRAACEVLGKRGEEKPLFVVGKDGRISGDMLEAALCAGIMSRGGNVCKLGVVPTPAVAAITRALHASAGVVISASHNPYEHNGIKFFNGEGIKLTDEQEEIIEELVNAVFTPHTGAKIGTMYMEHGALKYYTDLVRGSADGDFSNYRIVVDCANGATVAAAQEVFDALGSEVYYIGNAPNGININAKCGSTDPAALKNAVVEKKADIGIAFDGDGDRIIIVDERGEVVDGDKIIYILAEDMQRAKQLKKNCVAATVMSNMGVIAQLNKLGIEVVQTKVGDRYVLEAMRQNGFNLGGEQSGHIILGDYNTTGDGLITAMRFLSALKRSGQSVSSLAGKIERYPQITINVFVDNAKKHFVTDDREITQLVAEKEALLQGEGRVLLRASGTEAIVRVMVEGRDAGLIEECADELAAFVKIRLE